MELRVDEEFALLHRQLSDLELQQLEENILRDGEISSPIVAWEDYVLDGMHRMRIAEKHGLQYRVKTISLRNRQEAMIWIINHQLGQRNISSFEATRLRAEQAKLVGDTASVAKKHNVSQRTVQRDLEADRAKEKMSDDILARCESGSIQNSRADWKLYGQLTDSQRTAVDNALRRDTKLSLRQALPAISLGLSAADHEILQNSCLAAQVKKAIALGNKHASHKSIIDFEKLKDDQKQYVATIMEDPEVRDLGEAIKHFKSSRRPKPRVDKRSVARSAVKEGVDAVRQNIEDLHAVVPDKNRRDKCMDHVQGIHDQWEDW